MQGTLRGLVDSKLLASSYDSVVRSSYTVPHLLARSTDKTLKASQALLKLQRKDGHWCGDLTGDSTLLSDYIFLQLWLDPPNIGQSWRPANSDRIKGVVSSLLKRQLACGGWNIFRGGGAEINATVRAYTALRITGMKADSSVLLSAKERILALGGLQATNSYTKINLSLFGLYPRADVPSVPPEILIIPGSFLYEMSSWTRTIIVPLSIIQALEATRPTPDGLTIKELILPGPAGSESKRDLAAGLFRHADRLLKRWEKRGVKKLRSQAILAAERWMIAHMQHTDGLGGIYPAMMYSIMAMDSIGYERDHPEFSASMRHLEELVVDREGMLDFQPCKSPVWDTAITVFALGEAGALDAESATKAGDWFLQKEVRRKGDWSTKRPALKPSGWAFEFANEFYPDIDDTAMVLLALEHVACSDVEAQARAEARAIHWLLGMQSSDGGWAAFDVDNDWQLLNKVPFADHNAMLDPTCPDITGRVLEALCRRGLSLESPAVARGVRYLIDTQEDNGSWYGRWGVNYIYGTFLALRGLQAANDSSSSKSIRRAARWLGSVQNDDGGWGESCLGYETDTFVKAVSTPSQTAWAILGLVAAGSGYGHQVRAGVKWLLDRQLPDGTWEETLSTGTGFPNVYYLNYDMYRNYFPIMALARFRQLHQDGMSARSRLLETIPTDIFANTL